MSKKTIRVVVFLIGLFVAAQLIADVAATKFIELGGVVLPAGSLIFAITFTLRDMIHKRLGVEWAKAAIVTAALMNVLLALYMLLVSKLPAPSFYPYTEEWGLIFALVPAITFGSIIAEVVSGLTDTAVYQAWWDRFPKAPQWSRVLVSNAVALPVDSLVFTFLAFVIFPPLFGGDAMSFQDAFLRVVSGQVLWKAAVTVVSLPLIYAVGSKPILETQTQPTR